MRLDARIDIRKRADRARDCAGGDLLPRRDESLLGARKLGVEAGKLHAKGRWLRMDSVAAADRDGMLVLEGAFLERGKQLVDVGDQNVGGALQLHGKASV